MKKLVKIFSIIAILLLALTFTGCARGNEKYDQRTFDIGTIVLSNAEVKEGHTFIGYYSFSEKTGTLYLEGALVPAGTYDVIYVQDSKLATDGSFSFPEVEQDELNFAGWYQTSEFVYGQRVAESTAADEDHVIYAKYITYADAGLVVLVCILIVFGMLALLWGIVSLFKFIAPKGETKVAVPQAAPQVVTAPQRAFTIEDIKDEDMMAAALVATIDYHNETGENVRVVSVKQIG